MIFIKNIEEVMNQKIKQQRNNSLETIKIKVSSTVLVRMKKHFRIPSQSFSEENTIDHEVLHVNK